MTKQNHSDMDRVLAATSYLWILFLLPYTIGFHKPFVYRHAQQGLALFVFESILMAVAFVPILGWIAALIGWIFIGVNVVLGIGHAMSGQDWEVPLLHQFTHDPKHRHTNKR